MQTSLLGESPTERFAWKKKRARQALRRELRKQAGQVPPERKGDSMESEGQKHGRDGGAREIVKRKCTDHHTPIKKDPQEKEKSQLAEPSVKRYAPGDVSLSYTE